MLLHIDGLLAVHAPSSSPPPPPSPSSSPPPPPPLAQFSFSSVQSPPNAEAGNNTEEDVDAVASSANGAHNECRAVIGGQRLNAAPEAEAEVLVFVGECRKALLRSAEWTEQR